MQKLIFIKTKSGDVFVVLLGQFFEKVSIRQQVHLYWDSCARDTCAPNYQQMLNFIVEFWTSYSRGQPGRWDLSYRTSSIPIQELSAALAAFEF